MPTMQITFSDEEDKKLTTYKTIKGLVTKEQAVKELVTKIKFGIKKDGSLFIDD
jgi:hypothetical protein